MQKEVQMQTSQCAGLNAEIGKTRGVPGFPMLINAVMANIRRIANEGRYAGTARKPDLSIILDHQVHPIRPATGAEIRAQHQRGERIHFDRNELGVGKRLAGSQDEAPRAGTCIDDASRLPLTG
nr:hypothetical protein [Paracandidimonas lactea]